MMFLRALFALFAYDVVCKSCSFEAIYAMVRHWSISHKKNVNQQTAVDRACNAVNYACIWYPRQVLCLQRSFVTTYLLRKLGVDAHMVLGAQKLPFKAHAWVEVDGRAVNERSNVQATYAVWDRC
jgi:hypothetical protein